MQPPGSDRFFAQRSVGRLWRFREDGPCTLSLTRAVCCPSQTRILNPRMIRTLVTVFAGLLGLAFGSFLNVCLSRWPEGESVVTPPSHCRNCEHTLSWWENIPVLSWLILRGRCRICQNAISWRYPL